MSLSLNDENLIAQFTEAIYYPLLNHIPREWMTDFEDIVLRFDPSDHVCMAYATEGGAFSINIDLAKMEQVTRDQFKETPELQKLVIQYFGNLAFAIVRAFYRYNKDRHPEVTKDKEPEKVTIQFMTALRENAQKKLKQTRQYIV